MTPFKKGDLVRITGVGDGWNWWSEDPSVNTDPNPFGPQAEDGEMALVTDRPGDVRWSCERGWVILRGFDGRWIDIRIENLELVT